MARQRNIKPEFFTHADLAAREQATGLPLRVAFAGLWCQADRDGRFRWDPSRLKLAVLPFDPVSMEAVLEALVTGGYLQRYVVDGRTYAVIPTFGEHQQIHPREAASKIPAPPTVENQQAVGTVGDASKIDGNGQGVPDKAVNVQPIPGQVPESPGSSLPSPVDVPEAAGGVLPFSRQGREAAVKSTEQSGGRQAVSSGMSGPSEEQPTTTTSARAREVALQERLPAHCHAAMGRLLHAAGAGDAGVLDCWEAMLAGPIPSMPGVGPLTPEVLAEVIIRVSSATNPVWHQKFANRIVTSVLQEQRTTGPDRAAGPRESSAGRPARTVVPVL